MEHLEQKEGFRFHPTDSEGLKFLLRFIAKQEMHEAGFITTNIDVYDKKDPWEIYNHGVPCGGLGDDDSSSYRYFITKKSKTKDSWKQQDEEKSVLYDMKNSSSTLVIGCKKNMCYMINEHKDGQWLMKEYELSKAILNKFDEDRRDYILCVIKKKAINTCFSETSTINMVNNVSKETNEVIDSAHFVLATFNYSNLCRNLEHSESEEVTSEFRKISRGPTD